MAWVCRMGPQISGMNSQLSGALLAALKADLSSPVDPAVVIDTIQLKKQSQQRKKAPPE